MHLAAPKAIEQLHASPVLGLFQHNRSSQSPSGAIHTLQFLDCLKPHLSHGFLVGGFLRANNVLRVLASRAEWAQNVRSEVAWCLEQLDLVMTSIRQMKRSNQYCADSFRAKSARVNFGPIFGMILYAPLDAALAVLHHHRTEWACVRKSEAASKGC